MLYFDNKLLYLSIILLKIVVGLKKNNNKTL